MARKKQLTVDEVIDNYLCGTAKAAQLLGVTPQAVSMMRAKGRFPGRHHIKIMRVCLAYGVEYDPSL